MESKPEAGSDEAARLGNLTGDFRALFEAAPTPCLAVAPPDFIIVAVNEAYLRVTMTRREEILGRRLFDVFPDNPDDPGATGVKNLRDSLNRVLATRRTDFMPVLRYDVRRPPEAGDGFEERWWSPINLPILSATGEVALILHRIEDVTEVGRLSSESAAQSQLVRDQQRIIDRLRGVDAQLRESEERLQLALDASELGTFVWHVAEDRAEPDARTLELFDPPPGLSLTLANVLAHLIHPADRDRHAAAIARAIDPGGPGLLREEIRIQRSRGTLRWLSVAGRVHFEGDPPRAVRMAGTVADITSRKQTEAALRESVQRFRALVAATAYTTYRMSPDWSEMWELDGHGFLADTPRPTTTWLATYIPPEDQPQVRAAIAEAIRTKTLFELEHRVRRADGTYGWTHSRAVPLFGPDGEIVEWFGAASDVTARREAEGALRASEARYRTVFESMDEGFCVIEVLFDEEERPYDYRFLETNPAFLHQTGLVNAVGRTMRELAPDHESHWYDIYGSVVRTGEPIRFEAPAEALGRLYDVYAFRFGEPAARKVAVLFKDISERRRTEDALRETQRLESLGVLVAGIAHDFNNLLTPITGNVSLALRQLPAGPGSDTAELLEQALAASERAAGTVRQLVAYAGKGRYVVGPVDICKIVRDVAGLFRSSIPKSVEMRFELPEHCPRLKGDPNQLQQLIVNLVLNAGEAIGDRPGTVTLRARTVELDGDALRRDYPEWQLAPGRYLRFEVEDTGDGMDAATQARIFDPFFTTKFLGRGLGLPAAYGIVRGHRGALSVESTPGVGTIVHVLLPLETARPGATAETGTEQPRDESRGTIAVVDDEEFVRVVAQRALELAEYTVVTGATGAEAVELAQRRGGELDLMLIDLAMPVMGGTEAITRIRRDRPDLPLAVMTGFGDDATLERVAHLGVQVIEKPFRADQLADRVDSILRAHAAGAKGMRWVGRSPG